MAGGGTCVYFIACLVLVSLSDGKLKLNVPKLLLPYHSQVGANFTLEATEGCLFWKSTRTDVASVHPLEVDAGRGCSRKAVVTPVLRSPKRKTVIVIAEDAATGRELRCDVIIDKIVSFEIRTTTKELYLDDSPEEFNLFSYNDKGDVFSSLEGMEFEWSLLSDPDTGGEGDMLAPNKVLRILKFYESSYVAPEHIRCLEEQGKSGNMVLLRGLHTGTAIVQVRAVDEVYRNIDIPTVRAMVVANLQLSPGLVFLLLGDSIRFDVELLKQGKVHEVTMPSPLYYLEVDDSSIAEIDQSNSTLTGISQGFTELRLKGQNAQLAGIFREPSAGIHVVEPAYIEFNISPMNSWVLQTENVYTIFLRLYDESGHQIAITQNVKFETTFPSELLEVVDSVANGSYHVVRALSTGSSDLHSRLVSLTEKSGRIVGYDFVEGRQPFEVLEPVTLTPSVVVMPYLEGTTTVVNLQARGGTGSYVWGLVDSSLGSVVDGRVEVGSRVGTIGVRVVDSEHEDFAASSEVTLLLPTRMEFLDEKVEVEVGQRLRLPILMFGRNEYGLESRITKCNEFRFDIHTSQDDVLGYFEVSPVNESTGESCATLVVKGLDPGNTILTASDQLSGIKASIILAVYLPLQVLKSTDWIVLTPGSSGSIFLTGAPSPWVLDPSGFYRTAYRSSLEKVVSYGEVHWNSNTNEVGEHTFIVDCLDFGEATISVEIGNMPTQSNKNPDKSIADIKIFCSEPKLMKITSNAPMSENCPIGQKEGSNEVPVNVDESLTVRAELYDELSRIIINTSSLEIDWTIGDKRLASFEYKEDGRKDVILLRPTGTTGILTVSASVDSYGSEFNNAKLSTMISSSLSFAMMKQPSLSEKELVLYNHDMVKGKVFVSDGSDHYTVSSYGSDGVAKVTYDGEEGYISVVPLSEGQMKVVLSDLCLSRSAPAELVVFVSSVGSIQLSAPNKVPFHGEAKVIVEVFDAGGRAIPREFHSLMGLKFESSSNLLEIRSDASSSSSSYRHSTFVFEMLSLGVTKLVASIPWSSTRSGDAPGDGGGGSMVTCPGDGFVSGECLLLSNVVEIQVFAPLRIEPKEITITPGTAFQMQTFGGPQSEAGIEFLVEGRDPSTSSSTATIITISREGLVTGLGIGTGRVVARSLQADGDSVYSEDSATVNVVHMERVKIGCPIRAIQIENEMPLVVMGINDQAIEPYYIVDSDGIDWSVSDSSIAFLRNPFEINNKSSSLDLEGAHVRGLSARFVALRPGHVSVTLKVKDANAEGGYFMESVVIEVIDSLRLLLPATFGSTPTRILTTPETEMHLVTSLDDVPGTTVEFSVLAGNDLVTGRGENGRFRSGRSFGVVPMMVAARDGEGLIKRVLSLSVEVKPISYITLRPVSPFHDGTYRLPVGHTFDLEFSCHDDVGNVFHSTKADFSFQVNRIDSIEVTRKFKDENVLTVRTLRAGFTILKVYSSDDASIADYMGINVMDPLSPNAILVPLGSIICFKSLFPEVEDRLPRWSSTNKNLISVDQTGIAVTHGIGSAQIGCAHDRFTAETEVNILPAARVGLKPMPQDFVSNAMAFKMIEVSVISKVGSGNKMIIGNNCLDNIDHVLTPTPPFACSAKFFPSPENITLDQIFDVVPFFDIRTGKYYCKIITLDLSEELYHELSTVNSHVGLTVRPVNSTLDAEEEPSDMISLPFLPAFHVMEQRNLILDPGRTEEKLKIRTNEAVLKELTVTSSDVSIVQVLGIPRYSNNIATFYLSLVRLPAKADQSDSGSHVVKVTVTCIASGQVVDVPIRINFDGVKDLTPWGMVTSFFRDYYNWLFYGFILFASFLFLSLVYPLIQETTPFFTSNNSNYQRHLYQLQQLQKSPQHLRGYNTPAYSGGSPRKSRRLWTLESPIDRLQHH